MEQFEKRKQLTDHDLLINIDVNVENFIKRFEEHLDSDIKNFDKFNERVGFLEKGCYGVGGIVVFIEIISRLLK